MFREWMLQPPEVRDISSRTMRPNNSYQPRRGPSGEAHTISLNFDPGARLPIDINLCSRVRLPTD